MDTTKIVGEKIKSLREEKSITVEDLAERSGLTREQIERIEDNIDLPSLAPLIKIAKVFGVRLSTFMDEEVGSGPVICRNGEVLDTISFSNTALHSHQYMKYHSLSRSKMNRHMEPFVIDVEPMENNKDYQLTAHDGEEFIMVMEGTMEVCHGKNTYLLNPGDSIYYDSTTPHHVHAYKGKAAKILAVIYTPI